MGGGGDTSGASHRGTRGGGGAPESLIGDLGTFIAFITARAEDALFSEVVHICFKGGISRPHPPFQTILATGAPRSAVKGRTGRNSRDGTWSGDLDCGFSRCTLWGRGSACSIWRLSDGRELARVGDAMEDFSVQWLARAVPHPGRWRLTVRGRRFGV